MTSLGLPWTDCFAWVETDLAVVVFRALDAPLPMTIRSVDSSSKYMALASGVGFGTTLGAGAGLGLAGVGERERIEWSAGSDDIISWCDETCASDE